MSKLSISILLLLTFCFTSCGPPEEATFEQGSNDAFTWAEEILELGENENISEPKVYINEGGIDPFYYLRLKADSTIVNSIIRRFNLEQKTKIVSSCFDFDWFNPSQENSISFGSEVDVWSPRYSLTYDTNTTQLFFEKTYQ